MTKLTSLPPELLLLIINHLPTQQDLINAACVSKRLSLFALDRLRAARGVATDSFFEYSRTELRSPDDDGRGIDYLLLQDLRLCVRGHPAAVAVLSWIEDNIMTASFITDLVLVFGGEALSQYACTQRLLDAILPEQNVNDGSSVDGSHKPQGVYQAGIKKVEQWLPKLLADRGILDLEHDFDTWEEYDGSDYYLDPVTGRKKWKAESVAVEQSSHDMESSASHTHIEGEDDADYSNSPVRMDPYIAHMFSLLLRPILPNIRRLSITWNGGQTGQLAEPYMLYRILRNDKHMPFLQEFTMTGHRLYHGIEPAMLLALFARRGLTKITFEKISIEWYEEGAPTPFDKLFDRLRAQLEGHSTVTSCTLGDCLINDFTVIERLITLPLALQELRLSGNITEQHRLKTWDRSPGQPYDYDPFHRLLQTLSALHSDTLSRLEIYFPTEGTWALPHLGFHENFSPVSAGHPHPPPVCAEHSILHPDGRYHGSLTGFTALTTLSVPGWILLGLNALNEDCEKTLDGDADAPAPEELLPVLHNILPRGLKTLRILSWGFWPAEHVRASRAQQETYGRRLAKVMAWAIDGLFEYLEANTMELSHIGVQDTLGYLMTHSEDAWKNRQERATRLGIRLYLEDDMEDEDH